MQHVRILRLFLGFISALFSASGVVYAMQGNDAWFSYIALGLILQGFILVSRSITDGKD